MFESNEENILDDSEYIYDYLHQVLGIDQKDMMIFGRSMGSGPATHVANVREPGCLMMMSAFMSIRAIAQDQAGSLLKFLIQDRFNNIEKIKRVSCPTFLVHGMKDNLISFEHSKALHQNCGGPCSLIMPPKMDHNDFDFCNDLITPFFHFMKQCGIETRNRADSIPKFIPEEYLIIPKAYRNEDTLPTWSCNCMAPTVNMGAISVAGGADRDGNPTSILNQT